MKRSLIVVIAVLLFYRLFILAHSSLSFYSDDAIYAELARFWTQAKFDKAIHPTWPPLYPILSVIIYLVLGGWEISLQMVSVLASIGLLIIFYNFIQSKISNSAAVVGTLALGFLSPFLKLSLLPLSDMLSTAVVVAGLFCAYNALDQKLTKWYILAGILFGFTFLVRSEGTLFFMLSLIYFLVYFAVNFFLKFEKRMALAKKLIIFAITFAIVILPYVIITHNQLGMWTLSHKFSAQIKQGHSFELRGGTTWSQEVVSVKYPNYSSGYFSGGVNHLIEYIDWYWWWFQQKTQNWLGTFSLLFPLWFFIIFVVGGINSIHKSKSSIYFFFILITAVPVTFFVTSIADIRYLLWTIPLLFYFFINGINILKHKKISAIFLLLLVLVLPALDRTVILHPNEYAKYFTRNYYRPEIIQVSDWLNSNKKTEEPRIVMRHESVEFYTDGMTIYLPQQLSYEQTLAYAKQLQADYFVAWDEHLASDKNLAFLLDEKADPKGLKKVFSTTAESRRLILYEVLH